MVAATSPPSTAVCLARTHPHCYTDSAFERQTLYPASAADSLLDPLHKSLRGQGRFDRRLCAHRSRTLLGGPTGLTKHRQGQIAQW
jgi:hypothetical protein